MFLFTGTRVAGQLGGTQVVERPVDANGAFVLSFDDDGLASVNRAYFDETTILGQIDSVEAPAPRPLLALR